MKRHDIIRRFGRRQQFAQGYSKHCELHSETMRDCFSAGRLCMLATSETCRDIVKFYTK